MNIIGKIKNNKTRKPKNVIEKTKICKDCLKCLDISLYGKDKNKPDGLRSICKECVKLRNKNFYKNNQTYFSSYRKEYNKINNDLQIQRSREHYKLNKQKVLDAGKKYHKENKVKIQKRRTQQKRERYKTDPVFKIQINFRTRLNQFLKNKSKSKSIIELLGCTWEECVKYLEKQFLPEFTWGNHGIIWEIDHIKPCASFDLKDKIQQKECFHYTNLMPRFKTTAIAKEYGSDQIGNRDKGDKIL